MRIQIHAQDPELPPEFREFAEGRLSETLEYLSEHLTLVEVHMKDTNGQKRGIDKRCVIEARPRGMDPIAVEHDAAHAQDALIKASEKLKNALTSRLGRRAAR